MVFFVRTAEHEQLSSIPARITSVIVIAMLAMGCSKAAGPSTRAGHTMGTYYRVSLACDTHAPIDLAAELAAVNQEMSNYDPSSTLSLLNRTAVSEWYGIGNNLLEVLQYASSVHEQSHGAFDITIAPVLALWGFGPDAKELAAQPDPEALAVARSRVNMNALELRSSPAAARRRADITLDLSAIAKGHGVDRLPKLLDAAGCSSYLVDIGGEVRSRGAPNSERPWRVGVEVPDATLSGAVQRVITLRDQAIATSGDYRNFIQLETGSAAQRQSRWSHTIDPRTGAPVAHRLASVSVIAGSAMAADAWATALNVLGPEHGYELALERGLAAMFITRTAEGFEERYTPAFAAKVVPESP